MANKKDAIIDWGFKIFCALAVIYPLVVVMTHTRWNTYDTILPNLFPLFGILAFTLLWLHAVMGVFERWLKQYIDFDRFVSMTAKVILFSIILHPLLLLIPVGFNFGPVFGYGPLYIWLAIIGWLLLISYDITKPFKKKSRFVGRHWNNILLISNIGFLITFFHSLGVGDDLQSGPLHYVWIFYGVTAIAAIIWTYGIDRSWMKQVN